MRQHHLTLSINVMIEHFCTDYNKEIPPESLEIVVNPD